MKKIDGRKLTTEAQQQIRYAAIKLRKRGMTYTAIAEILGVQVSSAHKWWGIYENKGFHGLVIKKRGVKIGVNRRGPTISSNFKTNFKRKHSRSIRTGF